jgi:DNA-binding MarR family transcriptional regulator
MGQDISILISNTFKIAKYVAQVSTLPLEERTATMMQFHTLYYLKKNPNVTLSEVAKYLNASLSSTTQLIERMHKSEFLNRVHDENDRRAIRITLTDEGEKKLSQISEAKKDRMKQLLKNLSDEDVTELAKIQKKMIENIQEK